MSFPIRITVSKSSSKERADKKETRTNIVYYITWYTKIKNQDKLGTYRSGFDGKA